MFPLPTLLVCGIQHEDDLFIYFKNNSSKKIDNLTYPHTKPQLTSISQAAKTGTVRPLQRDTLQTLNRGW